MRDLVVTENITLDGVIDASEGWFDVTDNPELDQSDLQAALGEQAEAADAVLFGRVTFEEMRGYWPAQTAPGSSSFATGRPRGWGPAGCHGWWPRWPGTGRGAGRSRPRGA
jgi:dihydrofolate reductase